MVFLERQLHFLQDGAILNALAFLKIFLFLIESDSFLSQSRRFLLTQKNLFSSTLNRLSWFESLAMTVTII